MAQMGRRDSSLYLRTDSALLASNLLLTLIAMDELEQATISCCPPSQNARDLRDAKAHRSSIIAQRQLNS